MGGWGWVLIAITGLVIWIYIYDHIEKYKMLQKDIESQKAEIAKKNTILYGYELEAKRQLDQIENQIKEIKELEQKICRLQGELKEYQVDFNEKKEEYKKYVYALRDDVLQSLPEAIKFVPTLWADIKLSVLGNELAELEMWGCRIKATTYMALRQDIAKAKSYIELYKQYKYKYENLLITRHPNHEIENEQSVIRDLKDIVNSLQHQRNTILSEIRRLEKKVKETQEKWEIERKNILEKKIQSKEEAERWAEKIKQDEAVLKKQYKEETERCIKAVEEFAESKINYILAQGENHAVLSKMAEEWAEFNRAAWDYAIVYLLNKKRPIKIETATELRLKLKEYKEELFVKYKETQYKYNYLLAMFPELQEYIDGEAVQELSSEVPEELDDKRQYYIPKEEWETLNESQRSQIALNRYNERRRLTNSQVGRDYEEYVAFLFRDRCKGAVIDMYGEQKGLADLGRDLIVKHGGKVYIVQCKRWSQDKVIREKHIMQLFGSTIEYCWEMRKQDIHPLDVIGKSVIPVFVTTTELSSTATRFAERLGVVVHKVPMGEYPQIKCNIGRDGKKIYHLPFDQQYNSTIIEHNRGEFYAWNVEEAEKAGYRRAQRYIYN